MELKNYVKIYNDILPVKTLSNLIRYANTVNFEEAGVVANENLSTINKTIRDTNIYFLTRASDSMTDVHWTALLANVLKNAINKYFSDLKTKSEWAKILDIGILKYNEGGFYKYHIDHASQIPRTISTLFLLNNDYEGGELCFRNSDGSGEWCVKTQPNTLIVWPSNFLYPHTVKPVTKGIRYSIVGWAL